MGARGMCRSHGAPDIGGTLKPVRIGIVGIGKIARDQHIPALHANSDYDLVACASRSTRVDGVANFTTLEAMLDGLTELDAVTICTPPQVHYDAARLALTRGKHVFLEKPPCATTGELDRLADLARECGRTLYQSWHSRHGAGVEPARRWLEGRRVRAVRITWKEDVRHWHPGQAWIWEAGGFGVFDPGINAISILTALVHEQIMVRRAHFLVPENCEAPIAADVDFATDSGAPITAVLDFRQTGQQTWDIEIETDSGTARLSDGGARLFVDDKPFAVEAGDGEYPALYRHFAKLVEARLCDVDASPFRLVADAFLIARHTRVERFD
jgi:D-galactose 1-dehydrogenase